MISIKVIGKYLSLSDNYRNTTYLSLNSICRSLNIIIIEKTLESEVFWLSHSLNRWINWWGNCSQLSLMMKLKRLLIFQSNWKFHITDPAIFLNDIGFDEGGIMPLANFCEQQVKLNNAYKYSLSNQQLCFLTVKYKLSIVFKIN